MIFASFFLFWARLHTELISIYSPWDLNTGSHTPQIYFWLFPENICNQQDMLHMFIYTEGAQFPPSTIYLFQKKVL